MRGFLKRRFNSAAATNKSVSFSSMFVYCQVMRGPRENTASLLRATHWSAIEASSACPTIFTQANSIQTYPHSTYSFQLLMPVTVSIQQSILNLWRTAYEKGSYILLAATLVRRRRLHKPKCRCEDACDSVDCTKLFGNTVQWQRVLNTEVHIKYCAMLQVILPPENPTSDTNVQCWRLFWQRLAACPGIRDK
jgi:hypothetical protein